MGEYLSTLAGTVRKRLRTALIRVGCIEDPDLIRQRLVKELMKEEYGSCEYQSNQDNTSLVRRCSRSETREDTVRKREKGPSRRPSGTFEFNERKKSVDVDIDSYFYAANNHLNAEYDLLFYEQGLNSQQCEVGKEQDAVMSLENDKEIRRERLYREQEELEVMELLRQEEQELTEVDRHRRQLLEHYNIPKATCEERILHFLHNIPSVEELRTFATTNYNNLPRTLPQVPDEPSWSTTSNNSYRWARVHTM